jgi:hypothetical protein
MLNLVGRLTAGALAVEVTKAEALRDTSIFFQQDVYVKVSTV